MENTSQHAATSSTSSSSSSSAAFVTTTNKKKGKHSKISLRILDEWRKRLRNETAAAFFCQRFPFTGNTPTTANTTRRRRTLWRANIWFALSWRRSCWNTCCVNSENLGGKVRADGTKPQSDESSLELANHRPHVTAQNEFSRLFGCRRRLHLAHSAKSNVNVDLSVLNRCAYSALESFVCASLEGVQNASCAAPFTGVDATKTSFAYVTIIVVLLGLCDAC